MSIDLRAPGAQGVVYPETDGEPMAENTLQFEWIVTIKEGLEYVFRNDDSVFVAGDLFWYPIEGNNRIRMAPDTMVVFGRPKGHRRSYLQWQEDNLPPQVVFEVLSPGNSLGEMVNKLRLYERYGVEEYYLYDPDLGRLTAWQRQGDELLEIPQGNGWISPRLKVRFDMSSDELKLFGPDGRPFATYLELANQRDAMQSQRDAMQSQRDAMQSERDQLAKELEGEQERSARLAARLRELGVEPDL
jgi:Uma2 family endonuclease